MSAVVQRPWEHPLRVHHSALHRSCEQLLAEAKKHDRSRFGALWTAFECALLAHLTAEKAELLSAFSRVTPADAAAIAYEHAFFRSALTELGASRDLRMVKATAIETLVRQVREHVVREDRELYSWANRSLPTAALQRFRRATQHPPAATQGNAAQGPRAAPP
jgi:hypothetical protein